MADALLHGGAGHVRITFALLGALFVLITIGLMVMSVAGVTDSWLMVIPALISFFVGLVFISQAIKEIPHTPPPEWRRTNPNREDI